MSRYSRWNRGVSAITLLTVTSCTTLRELPPSALQDGARARDSTKTGRPPEPGQWHFLRGYTDSRGRQRSVSGRVRAIPDDSLELDVSDPTWSLTPESHRSVVPRDSIQWLQILEPDLVRTFVGIALISGVIIWFIAGMRSALEHIVPTPARVTPGHDGTIAERRRSP